MRPSDAACAKGVHAMDLRALGSECSTLHSITASHVLCASPLRQARPCCAGACCPVLLLTGASYSLANSVNAVRRCSSRAPPGGQTCRQTVPDGLQTQAAQHGTAGGQFMLQSPPTGRAQVNWLQRWYWQQGHPLQLTAWGRLAPRQEASAPPNTSRNCCCAAARHYRFTIPQQQGLIPPQ